MAQQPATATSVKISKNARSSGTKTEKFLCECSGEIKMVQVFLKGKMRMLGRCDKCGQEGRSPKTMNLKKEIVEITRIL